jgi:membrane carboxypeptidase/penicillin-binding protein
MIQKLKEWIIAVKLERNFTKEEIIALYLNAVHSGIMYMAFVTQVLLFSKRT